jgi:hypothetical protein
MRDHMNEKEWEEETQNPSGYLKKLGAGPSSGNSHV